MLKAIIENKVTTNQIESRFAVVLCKVEWIKVVTEKENGGHRDVASMSEYGFNMGVHDTIFLLFYPEKYGSLETAVLLVPMGK